MVVVANYLSAIAIRQGIAGEDNVRVITDMIRVYKDVVASYHKRTPEQIAPAVYTSAGIGDRTGCVRVSLQPSLRAVPVYDRPGRQSDGRGSGTEIRVSAYVEPAVETLRYLFVNTLPAADRPSVISTYGVGAVAPAYDKPLTPNDVMAVRTRGRPTIELSSGDTEAETPDPVPHDRHQHGVRGRVWHAVRGRPPA